MPRSRSLGGPVSRWMIGLLLAIPGLLFRPASAQDPWTAPGVSQAGFHAGVLPGTPYPPQWHGSAQQTIGGPETMYHLLPADRGAIYDHDSPLDLAFKDTLSRSWIRVDYLLWDLNSPGKVLLGAPMTGLTGFPRTNGVIESNVSQRVPFFVTDSRSTRINVLAQNPSLDNARDDDRNGIRGTIGVPFTTGTFEADVWWLQGFNYDIRRPPVNFSVDGTALNTFPLISAIGLTADGQVVSDSMILFNRGFEANLGTQIFGTEFNWVQNPVTPGLRSSMQPLFGFRYIRVADRLRIFGSDVPDELNEPDVVLNHLIDSRVRNNIFGPHIGFRSETNLGHVVLGVEPKFTFGLNRLEESVSTQQLLSVDEQPRLEADTRNRFSPTLDLSVYVNVNLTEQLSFRVGYDLLWIGGVSRAFNNIRYDAPADPSAPPNVSRKNDLTTLFAHGLVLGGEYVFR